MKIQWLGTATVIFRFENSEIMFDPYNREWNEKLPQLTDIHERGLEAVFITHPHLDHFSNIEDVLGDMTPYIFVVKRGIELAQRDHKHLENLREIKDGDRVVLKECNVKAYQSRHCRIDRGLRRETARRIIRQHQVVQGAQIWHENRRYRIGLNDILAYEVEAEGKHIFVMGSANLKHLKRYPQNPDLLLLPFQGKKDMDDYALNLVRRINPKAIMLTHFDNAFPPVSGKIDTKSFEYMVKEELGIPCFVPKERAEYEL